MPRTLLVAVAEYEAEQGAFTEAELAEADRILDRGTVVEPLDGVRARAAAALLGRTDGGSGAVDAIVVEGALRRHESVVSSDRGDLQRLADAAGRRLDVIDA